MSAQAVHVRPVSFTLDQHVVSECVFQVVCFLERRPCVAGVFEMLVFLQITFNVLKQFALPSTRKDCYNGSCYRRLGNLINGTLSPFCDRVGSANCPLSCTVGSASCPLTGSLHPFAGCIERLFHG